MLNLEDVLQEFKRGAIDMAEAKAQIKNLNFYEDIDFAKLDHQRKARRGHVEFVYCAGKSAEQVAGIFYNLAKQSPNVLGTRASYEHYAAVKACFSERRLPSLLDCLTYSEAGILLLEREKPQLIGEVAIVTAGTSDYKVAAEAEAVLYFLGNKVTKYYDCGVAGLHRLLDKINDIRKANCIICIAGMEGALASVVAGLVDVPVIAVPTSVGYGANFNGLAALLTMLNSCAEGVSTVNIDNGFGAANIAGQINRLAVAGSYHDVEKTTV